MRLPGIVVAAALLAGGQASALAQEDLARNLAAQCASCHASSGAGAGANPGSATAGIQPLAGRPGAQIIALMNDFKSGKRDGAQGTLMPQLAKGYTDAEIALIADYLSRQKPAP